MVARLNTANEFMDWLKSDETECEFVRGSWYGRYIRVSKNDKIDYLYHQPIYCTDNGITKDKKFEYAGIYCKADSKLYDVSYTLSEELKKDTCAVHGKWNDIVEKMCEDISRKVEDIIANDRCNLAVTSLTDSELLRSLQDMCTYNAYKIAREAFLSSEKVGDFHCSYRINQCGSYDIENTVLDYLVTPEAVVLEKARKYIDANQEYILYKFLANDLIQEQYDAIVANPADSAHTVKRIMEAVALINAKTIHVTIRMGDAKGAFKLGASQFKDDCGSHGYNIWSLTRAEMKRFESLFGQHESNFAPSEITKITYGKKILYEAVPGATTEMGNSELRKDESK